MNNNITDEKSIFNFRVNGIHFHVNDIGLSVIWGSGSYSENQNKLLDFSDKPKEGILDIMNTIMPSHTMEIYALEGWSKKLEKKVLSHFKYDEFPVGYVDIHGLVWVLNQMEKDKSNILPKSK